MSESPEGIRELERIMARNPGMTREDTLERMIEVVQEQVPGATREQILRAIAFPVSILSDRRLPPGVEPRDINLVMDQRNGTTREEAIAALQRTGGDVVNAIIDLGLRRERIVHFGGARGTRADQYKNVTKSDWR